MRRRRGGWVVYVGQFCREKVSDFLSRLEAIAGSSVQQAADERFKPLGNVRVKLSDWTRGRLADFAEQAHQCFRTKRRTPNTHCVHHAAEAKQISARVGSSTIALLRRHILWGSRDNPTVRKVIV